MENGLDPKNNNDGGTVTVVLKELRDLRTSNDALVREVHSLTRLVEKLMAQKNVDPMCVSCASGFPKPSSASIWDPPVLPKSPNDIMSFLRRDPTTPLDRSSTLNTPPEISSFMPRNPFGNMPTFHGPVPFPPAVGHSQRFGPSAVPKSMNSLHQDQPHLVPMFDDFFENVQTIHDTGNHFSTANSEIEDLISLDRASANLPLPLSRSENVV